GVSVSGGPTPPAERARPPGAGPPAVTSSRAGPASCSASTPPTGSGYAWPTSAATGWPRPASRWPMSRSRSPGAALASAALEPARVLAVTVGVPTPVGADGRLVGREAYLPGLPGRDLRPEIGGRHGLPR